MPFLSRLHWQPSHETEGCFFACHTCYSARNFGQPNHVSFCLICQCQPTFNHMNEIPGGGRELVRIRRCLGETRQPNCIKLACTTLAGSIPCRVANGLRISFVTIRT
eukprot:9486319-Pyramimonas_sp.AAC.1